MTKLLPILLPLLLSTGARADMFELVITGEPPIIVELLAPLPPRFSEAINTPPAAIIHHADWYSVDGGFYTGPDSFDYLPSIPPTNLPQSHWSFSVWAADPARWRINQNYLSSPDYIALGTVVYGFNTLTSLADGDHASVFGIADVPVDAGGNPFVITHYYDLASETLDATEPACVPLIAAAMLACTFPWSKK